MVEFSDKIIKRRAQYKKNIPKKKLSAIEEHESGVKIEDLCRDSIIYLFPPCFLWRVKVKFLIAKIVSRKHSFL